MAKDFHMEGPNFSPPPSGYKGVTWLKKKVIGNCPSCLYNSYATEIISRVIANGSDISNLEMDFFIRKKEEIYGFG